MSVPVHQDAYPQGGRDGYHTRLGQSRLTAVPQPPAPRVVAPADLETATEDLLDRYEALLTELQRQIVTLRLERDQARAQVPAGDRTCTSCAARFASLGQERICRACRRQTAARAQERFRLKATAPIPSPPPRPVVLSADLRACRECTTPFPRYRNKQLCDPCVTAHRKRWSRDQYVRTHPTSAKESV